MSFYSNSAVKKAVRMKIPSLAFAYVGLALAGGFGAMMIINKLLFSPTSYSHSYAALTNQPTAMYMFTVKANGVGPKYTEYDLRTKHHVRLLSYRPVQPEKRSLATAIEAPDFFIYVTVHAKDDESIRKLEELGFRETGAGPTLTEHGTNPHDLYIKLS